MQRRVITPYPDAPDLSVYEDLNSAFSPKSDEELDHSCRYRNINIFSIPTWTVIGFVS